MNFKVRPELKMLYPGAHFGSIAISNIKNTKTDQKLETAKRKLEKKIRETYPDPKLDPTISNYQQYYNKWNKTYPITYQIKSIKNSKQFPKVSTYVDAMFLSELENRILTSGHDREAIQGTPTYSLADEGENYIKLNGKQETLHKNDIVLRDEKGVLASILYGPAKRTSITNETINPVYFAWCPIGITVEEVDHHLDTIHGYLGIAYQNIQYDKLII